MEKIVLDVIEYTNRAMLYELFTDPSFGLVSPYTNGAHKDMDHFTFIDSISVLNKYMLKFAKLGYQAGNIRDMYEDAVQIGLDCETEMFLKTKGVNTHKGLIFVLGTLVCSYCKTLYDNGDLDSIFTNSQLLVSKKMDEFNSLNLSRLSNGEKVFLKYNIEGVRKEASLGFPIIRNAIGYLDLNDKTSLVKTLIFIMSECDDTTIINRVGLRGLHFVKENMKEMLNKGIEQFDLKQIEQDFITRGISPGGSADLLCGTIFVSLIKNNNRERMK